MDMKSRTKKSDICVTGIPEDERRINGIEDKHKDGIEKSFH